MHFETVPLKVYYYIFFAKLEQNILKIFIRHRFFSPYGLLIYVFVRKNLFLPFLHAYNSTQYKTRALLCPWNEVVLSSRF